MSARGPDGIVTPEAVLLELETAGAGSRVLAALLDVMVQGTALLAVGLVLGLAAGDGELPAALVAIVVAVVVFLILIGYPVAMETLWNGRTLGKAALGLRAVTVEGAPLRFRHAAIRGAVGLVDFYIPPGGVVALLAVLLTRRNQRLGDLAAGTVVLRERTGAAAPLAVTFPPPPGYEAYAASLDVAAVTVEQYGVVRSFLLRVFNLSPGARASLALRLANPVAARMGHTPPLTVGPELFLACVAAAYQRRHGGPWVPAAPPPGAGVTAPPPPPPPPPAPAPPSGFAPPR